MARNAALFVGVLPWAAVVDWRLAAGLLGSVALLGGRVLVRRARTRRGERRQLTDWVSGADHGDPDSVPIRASHTSAVVRSTVTRRTRFGYRQPGAFLGLIVMPTWFVLLAKLAVRVQGAQWLIFVCFAVASGVAWVLYLFRVGNQVEVRDDVLIWRAPFATRRMLVDDLADIESGYFVHRLRQVDGTKAIVGAPDSGWSEFVSELNSVHTNRTFTVFNTRLARILRGSSQNGFYQADPTE